MELTPKSEMRKSDLTHYLTRGKPLTIWNLIVFTKSYRHV